MYLLSQRSNILVSLGVCVTFYICYFLSFTSREITGNLTVFFVSLVNYVFARTHLKGEFGNCLKAGLLCFNIFRPIEYEIQRLSIHKSLFLLEFSLVGFLLKGDFAIVKVCPRVAAVGTEAPAQLLRQSHCRT